MAELTLKIDGMHCEACVRRVSNALKRVPGAHARHVEIGSASVQYDPAQASPERIAKAVEDIGFTPTVRP